MHPSSPAMAVPIAISFAHGTELSTVDHKRRGDTKAPDLEDMP
jgi:hypothetical protein